MAQLMDKHRGRHVLLPLLIMLALAVNACGTAGDSANDNVAKGADTTPSAAPKTTGPDLVTEAIRSGQPVTCTLIHDGSPLTVYVKSDRLFRVDAKTPAGISRLLYKDRMVHIWVGKMRQGFKISTDAKTPLGSGIKMFTPKEIEALPGNEGTTCKVYVGSNSVFKLPSGVTFGPLPINPIVPGL